MKEQRIKKNEEYTTRSNTLQKKIQEETAYKATFRDTAWERILKPNETDFQEAFSGFRNNKERFRDEVLRRYHVSHSSSETRDNLLLRAKTLFAQKPENRASINQISRRVVLTSRGSHQPEFPDTLINKTMSMMRSALFRLRVGNQKKSHRLDLAFCLF